jgi:GTPase SAR1 family protein
VAALNPKAREIAIKVVYYGPGLGGKTSTLEALHRTTVPERRGKLLSLATPVDRTLFFDFLPLRPEIQRAPGAPPESVPSVRLQLFTVPGQVYFNATRKLVLTGADGVVFVADSQTDRLDANQESLENLRENLREHGRNVDEVPLVLQYTTRDLPRVATMEELDRVLNPKGLPSFGTSAVRGDGIREALDRVLSDVLAKLGSRENVPRSRSATHNIAIKAVEGGLSEEIARAADLARAPVIGFDTHVAPPSAAPRLESTAPTGGVSFATLWEDQGRDLAADVERLISTRRYADSVRAADALLGAVVASTAAVVGSHADPTLAPLLLGIDARRYLGFRSLCRAAESGETILLEHALAAYALVVDAQLALRTAL